VAALRVEVLSLVEWLASAYRATGSTSSRRCGQRGYRGITAPSILCTATSWRTSDEPGAHRLGGPGLRAEVQAIEALILLAGLIMDTNYWTGGARWRAWAGRPQPGRDPPDRRHGELR